MRLIKLTLQKFRNYQTIYFSPHDRFNYLFGPNGAGKTNLLEGAYFLAHLRSFRRVPRRALVMDGEKGMYLRGVFGGVKEGTFSLEAAIHGENRRYRVDGLEQGDLSSYLGMVYIVVFFPESLQLVKGSPALRRAFFDRAISAEDRGHLADLREYNRLVAERNRFLREKTQYDIIRTWEERIFLSASRIVARRCRFLGSLIRNLRILERGLCGLLSRSFSVRYVASGLEAGVRSWETLIGKLCLENEEPVIGIGKGGGTDASGEEAIRGALREAAARSAEMDKRKMVTGWGPHLDDFAILWGEDLARSSGSQGEQRLLAVLLVLSTAARYREVKGEPPIVLLDDLHSELDADRRDAVVDILRGMEAQVFITSTDRLGRRPAGLEGSHYLVRAGGVTAC